MFTRRTFRTRALLVGSLLLAATLTRDAAAVRDLGIFCTPDINSPDVRHINCAFGVEDTDCGSDWTCQLVNLVSAPGTYAWDCNCSEHAKNYWSLPSWFTFGNCSAQKQGDLIQNSSTDFLVQYALPDSMFIVLSPNIQADGNVSVFQTLTGSGDVSGTFTVTLGSGPSNAIPIRITALNLTVASFNLDGGRTTGSNQIVVTPSGTSVVGTYDSTVGSILFAAPILCTWTSSLYPGGSPLYLRPMLRSFGGGSWQVALRGFADFSPAAGVPGLPVYLAALLLFAGTWAAWRVRRARAEA